MVIFCSNTVQFYELWIYIGQNFNKFSVKCNLIYGRDQNLS